MSIGKFQFDINHDAGWHFCQRSVATLGEMYIELKEGAGDIMA
jgi:hypothetical protein